MFVIFHHGREILTSALDFILASCDVEGNFLVVTDPSYPITQAYNYTDLLSCMLLDA
jgi:hypothetical protein